MLMMNTGHTQTGRPSLGSWLTYGLARTTRICRATSCCARDADDGGPPLWNNAFLPAVHQGTFIADRSSGRIRSSARTSIPRSWCLHLQQGLHAHGAAAGDGSARASSTSCAARPRIRSWRRDLVDGSRLQDADRGAGGLRHPQGERGHAQDVRHRQHGARLSHGGAAGRARRRMVQVYYAHGDPWDHHGDIQYHRRTAKDSDQRLPRSSRI
jgi:hypothetical protein